MLEESSKRSMKLGIFMGYLECSWDAQDAHGKLGMPERSSEPLMKLGLLEEDV